MQILERDTELDSIRRRFDAIGARAGGVCVIVSGEAGIGKTTLMRAFAQSLPPQTALWQCGCEPLFTPRPLGPLIDLAARFPPSVAHALQQGITYNALFPKLLDHFGDRVGPGLLVIEDLQWADVGTLDFVRFLGRRIETLPLMLFATHRGERFDAEHPLPAVLGDLPAARTLRLRLEPLSRAAVQTLAQAAQRSGAEVFAATNGNPFYVTEVLAAPPSAVPTSVRDAVLAAMARLTPVARDLACAVSLFPSRVGMRVLAAMSGLAPTALGAVDECLHAGVLHVDGDSSAELTLAFRHEITRNVVHDALSAPARVAGHAAAFRALQATSAGDDELARCVHHAEAAGLTAAAAALAPTAARRAATTGDHREAARLYALALEGAGATLDDAAQARLLEAWAGELTLINRHREAIAAREQALAIHRRHGDRLREGINQRWLARLHWFDRGGQSTCVELARQAIETLQALPVSRELALAYSTLSHLCLVREDMAGTQLWGLRAIELAEATDDAEAMTHALNNVGTAILRQRDDALAWNRLTRSLELALEHGLAVDAARAYNNLFILCVIHHDFAQGLRYAEQGIEHCEAHGLDVFTVRILIRRAFARIVMGRWALAEADLDQIAQRHAPSPMEASTHAFVASVLALRQGQPDAAQRLRDSIAAMHAHRVEIWFITTAAAQAEAAWLEGDVQALDAAARPALAAMVRIGDRWRAGELAAWLQRSGRAVDAHALPEWPTPYTHELAGRWRDAAAAWQRLGCPYDQALALCSGDDAALAEALALFDALGARAAAERVRALLRERGVRGVPRGPQPRTRGDPLNLTARERQIFELLCRGLSNAAIAAELRRSERTVEHHVSALLRKCGAATRVELLARHGGARGGP